jgi:hypothetical protein
VIKLIEYLYKNRSKFNDKSLNKASIHKCIFKNSSFNDKVLRNTLSKTFTLLENFLINEKINADKNLKVEVLSQWRKLGNYKNLEKTARIIQGQLESSTIKNLDHIKTQTQLEEELYLSSINQGTRNLETNLLRIINFTDQQYIYQKLKVGCDLLNAKKIISDKANLGLFEPILDYLNDSQILVENQAVNIYYQLINLLLSDDEEYFNNLKALLATHYLIFEKEEAQDLYAYLNNYCIQRVNKGDESYLTELFNNYKALLKQGTIIINDKINLFDFKNIATVSIRLKEYNWTLNFTNQYSPFLESKQIESASAYNTSRVYFYQSKYRDAIQALRNVNYSDVYYELGCRSLILKTYYEQNEFDLFMANAQSFRQFLIRNENISDYQRKIYLNFLKYSKMLFTVKNGNTRKFKEIQEQVEASSNIADLTWIKEKIMELTN